MALSGARGPQESSWGPDSDLAERVTARRLSGFQPSKDQATAEDVHDFETAALEGAVDRLQQGMAKSWNKLDPNAFDWPPAGTEPPPIDTFDPWHPV